MATFPRPETWRWMKRTVIGCLTCWSHGLMGGPWPMKATIHSRPSAVSLKVWLHETREGETQNVSKLKMHFCPIWLFYCLHNYLKYKTLLFTIHSVVFNHIFRGDNPQIGGSCPPRPPPWFPPIWVRQLMVHWTDLVKNTDSFRNATTMLCLILLWFCLELFLTVEQK